MFRDAKKNDEVKNRPGVMNLLKFQVAADSEFAEYRRAFYLIVAVFAGIAFILLSVCVFS